MASPSTAAPTADEQAEADYRALELKFFKSRHPSSARHHAEWVRAKERYHELRLEYLEVLDVWPGWTIQKEGLERLLEASADLERSLLSAKRRYEAHARRIDQGLVDPADCQLCHARVLARTHPKYNQGIEGSAGCVGGLTVKQEEDEDEERALKKVKVEEGREAK